MSVLNPVQPRDLVTAFKIAPEFTQIGDKIIGPAPWGSAGDQRVERFMVFTNRDSKIVDMQGLRHSEPPSGSRTP